MKKSVNKKIVSKKLNNLMDPKIETPEIVSNDLKELDCESKVIDFDQKSLKKKEQNKRVWLSCEKKGHFGCMVPSRYLSREGIREKLRCPICNEILKLKEDRKDEVIELVANKQ